MNLYRALPANVHQVVLQFLQQAQGNANVSLTGPDLASFGQLLNETAQGKKKDKDRYAFTEAA
jgi:hypothetical protein